MNKELVRSKVVEIKALHQEVIGSVKMTLEKVIQIGRLLRECKKEVGHGMWMTWVEANRDSLGFSYFTANNYINCFERKGDPEFLTVKNLREIYYPQQIEHKPQKKEPVKVKQPEQIANEWAPPAPVKAPIVEKEDVFDVEPTKEQQYQQIMDKLEDMFLELSAPWKVKFINWILAQDLED